MNSTNSFKTTLLKNVPKRVNKDQEIVSSEFIFGINNWFNILSNENNPSNLVKTLGLNVSTVYLSNYQPFLKIKKISPFIEIFL